MKNDLEETTVWPLSEEGLHVELFYRLAQEAQLNLKMNPPGFSFESSRWMTKPPDRTLDLYVFHYAGHAFP